MSKIKLLTYIVLITSIFCISGCGKVSNLRPMDGSGYPHSYPRN